MSITDHGRPGTYDRIKYYAEMAAKGESLFDGAVRPETGHWDKEVQQEQIPILKTKNETKRGGEKY
jgi:hypothetical protein